MYENKRLLLEKIKLKPESVTFNEVISFISENYHYREVAFMNGIGSERVSNEAGTNEGSCKIFSFAKQCKLSELATLHCFGDYYRCDVLGNPEGTDHGNIRAFMRHGWEGIVFEGDALQDKRL